MSRPPTPTLSPLAAAMVPELLAWLRALADSPGDEQPGLALWCGTISAHLHMAAEAAHDQREDARPVDPLASGPVREAMVLGHVHGLHFERAHPHGAAPYPPDSSVVHEVLRAARANADRFPYLAAIARREMIEMSDPVVMAWLRDHLGVKWPPDATSSD